MTALLLALAMLRPSDGGAAVLPPIASRPMRTELPATGMATYYAPGLMRQVYLNRIAMGQIRPCPECVGLVAMRYPEDLGRKVWIRYDGVLYGPFLVVDCAAEKDLPRMIASERIVEVDYDWALEWWFSGPVPVEVFEYGDDRQGGD